MRRLDDPAWLEQQYNNRARVPDWAEHVRKWTEASALTRQQSDCTLDIAYGDGAGERLDLFRPVASQGRAPVLVFIHGGYWRSLDKSQHSFVAASFNAEGALVVVPDYALAPAVTLEHIALQMTRALAWVWRNAAHHGGDPRRIVVAGHSAGGHLAAMLLTCRWKSVSDDLPLQAIAGALSISGLYDLEPMRLTPSLQADLRLTPASVKRLSPAFFPRPRSRLVTVVGEKESEEFLRHNQLIRDQWGPTAVPVCEAIPGADHFSILRQLADPASRLHGLGRQLLGLA